MGFVLSQRNFAGGEIDPKLHKNITLNKWLTGLATQRNAITEKTGALSNRAGTEFIGEVKDSTEAVKLIPFIFNDDQTYQLEFGNLYLRIIHNDAYVTVNTQNITAISNAGPMVLTYSGADNYAAGEEVYLTGILGDIGEFLNGRNFKVATVNTGTNTLTLNYMNGDPVNSNSFGAYTSAGTIRKIYEIATSYDLDSLPDLKYDQKDDIMTVTHPSFQPAELSRSADDAWAFKNIRTNPSGHAVAETIQYSYPVTNYPSIGTVTKTTSRGDYTNKYRVTGINKFGEESNSGFLSSSSTLIASITKTSPPLVTMSVVPTYIYEDILNNDQVYIYNCDGMTELNGRYFTATRLTMPVSTISNANPAVVTYDNTNYEVQTGDTVELIGLTGSGNFAAVTNARYVATRLTPTTFRLNGLDSSGFAAFSGTYTIAMPNKFYLNGVDATAYGAFTGSGLVKQATVGCWNCPPLSATEFTVLQIANLSATYGTIAYRVYKYKYGVYGLLATVGAENAGDYVYFQDDGTLTPDISSTPPMPNFKFETEDDYPRTVAYLQQRQMFAGSNNAPSLADASRIGSYKNFCKKNPITDDDPFSFSLVGGQRAQIIYDLMDLGGKGAAFTSAGVWILLGDQNGILTPTDVNPKRASGFGSNGLKPLVVGESAVFVQARGSAVRDLAFDISADGYKGPELTNFAGHLIKNKTIVDWAYQETPHSIIWAVLDDGTVIALTYIKDQQIFAWHRHDFGDGFVENVCSTPDGNVDAVFFVIKRTINGETKRYVEKLSNRDVADIVDANLTECAVTYDGRNVTDFTMSLTGGTNWDETEDLTLTFNGLGLFSYFTSSMVGDEIHLTDADGVKTRFKIVAYTSTTVVTVRSDRRVPALLVNIEILEWARAVSRVTNLWHLEGEYVSIFADGTVLASPNNVAYAKYKVENGAIQLNKCFVTIHYGLPFISDIETLSVDTANGQSLASEDKLISDVILSLFESRGVWVGRKAPDDDSVDPLQRLFEMKLINQSTLDQSPPLYTGDKSVGIQSNWEGNGKAFIRQVDPVPFTICAIHPVGEFNFKEAKLG